LKDLNRRIPYYQSPYDGPMVNENTSGISDDYDTWWTDGVNKQKALTKKVQTEYITDIDCPWIDDRSILLQTLYFLGWFFSCYTLYMYFFHFSVPHHLLTWDIMLTEKERMEAIALNKKRKEDMEKYGIKDY
jgi:hypothetical protein